MAGRAHAQATGETEGLEPHHIRLADDKVPKYLVLPGYQAWCWQMMGPMMKGFEPDQQLEEDLLKAHMQIRPEEYVAFTRVTVFLSIFVGLLIGSLVAFFIAQALLMGWMMGIIIGGFIVFLAPLVTWMGLTKMMFSPASAAKVRASNIDHKLPYAMSFISALSSADVNIDVIFKELAREPLYGEIQKEAEWITRDTELLGKDILTAIKDAARRTPSEKFQDFMQGVVTTSTSGGQLKPYFLLKSVQFQKEADLEAKKTMETLAMLAESYVTVVVAFPLFLVVILAIMALMGGGGAGSTTILKGVVYGMIPVSQFGFIFIIWNIQQEA